MRIFQFDTQVELVKVYSTLPLCTLETHLDGTHCGQPELHKHRPECTFLQVSSSFSAHSPSSLLPLRTSWMCVHLAACRNANICIYILKQTIIKSPIFAEWNLEYLHMRLWFSFTVFTIFSIPNVFKKIMIILWKVDFPQMLQILALLPLRADLSSLLLMTNQNIYCKIQLMAIISIIAHLLLFPLM